MRTGGIVSTHPSRTGDAQRREARLRHAAEQFEAVFLQTLLKSMRATVPESGLLGNSGEAKIYRQMLDEELSRRVAGESRFGIAEMLVRRYRPLVDREAPDATAAERPGTSQRQALAAAPGTSASVPHHRDGPVSAAPAGRTRGPVRPHAAPAPAASPERPSRQALDETPPPALLNRARRLDPAVADTLRRYARPIVRAARETGLPPALILSVVTAESGGRSGAVSPRGALGLMQLMPETAAAVGVDDPFDPEQNITGGSRYLAGLHRRFGGDLALALAGYNAGPGSVERAGGRVPPFPETRRYVQKVLHLYRALGAGAPGGEERNHGATEE